MAWNNSTRKKETMETQLAARPREGVESTSPIGQTLDEEHAVALRDSADRAEHERLAAFEQLARLVIIRRAQLGISQADLARRMGKPSSVVSRIESGQHATNTATLKRLAEALEARALLGFDFMPARGEAARREVVSL